MLVRMACGYSCHIVIVMSWLGVPVRQPDSVCAFLAVRLHRHAEVPPWTFAEVVHRSLLSSHWLLMRVSMHLLVWLHGFCKWLASCPYVDLCGYKPLGPAAAEVAVHVQASRQVAPDSRQ